MQTRVKGKVYLVGAGPGDPDLITLKGLEILREADVVIYDRLADDALLSEVRPEAERIYVGKAAGQHTPQETINQLLLEKACEGKLVARLKGGDPFVLGRGGEEAKFLAENRIPFKVVPGVSSAAAVPAYAGIPLTYRGLASSFAVVTGHEADKESPGISWEKLSTAADTLVILMGMRNLAQIVRRLIQNGRPPSTPAAVISQGTSQRQKCVTGVLEDIIVRVEQEGLKPPGVVVVGEVAGLRENLCWFNNQPLFGKRVLVTRASHQASSLSKLLRRCGAVPVGLSTLRIEKAADELDQAILNLDSYNWLIFTSVNGVEAFFERLSAQKLDARKLSPLCLGVIGPATAEALGEKGLKPDYIPQEFTSKGFLAGLKGKNLSGLRVLLPRSDKADKELPRGLARLGAEVHEAVAYKALPAKTDSEEKQKLLSGEIDLVTFTSSSTVINLVNALGEEKEAINKAFVACIGPKTAAAAAEAGLRVDIVARTHTIPGLVEAMEEYFHSPPLQKGERGGL